jgi:hypothetical protein
MVTRSEPGDAIDADVGVVAGQEVDVCDQLSALFASQLLLQRVLFDNRSGQHSHQGDQANGDAEDDP